MSLFNSPIINYFSLVNLDCVRTLHPNLTFHMADMKNAIGTSIRSARSTLRRNGEYHQQHLNMVEHDENVDPDERNETMDGVSNDDNIEDDDVEDEASDGENEDDSGVGNAAIDDYIDEATDDE